MGNLKNYGKIRLTISFKRFIEDFESGVYDKKLLYATHTRIVNTIIDYFRKQVIVMEYMSENKIINDKINLYIKFEGKLDKTYKEYESELYRHFKMFLPPTVLDNLDYPNVICIETY